jgi:CheY-like chemotaxis protein
MPDRAQPTVLVIDDNADLLDSLRLVLELNGFTTVTAENGVRGLQAFRNRQPAVVLLDIMMPRLDGMETIGQMRRERPDAKIVAMSGGNVEFRSSAIKRGAVAAIEKPFDPVALIDLLRTLLAERP